MLFEPEIVIFPPGPGSAPSSRESSCPLSRTLITVRVVFALVTLVVDRVGDLTVVLVAALVVVDRVGDLTVVLVVPLVVVDRVGELTVVLAPAVTLSTVNEMSWPLPSPSLAK